MSGFWNYRVVKRPHHDGATYGVHEAFYEDDQTIDGRPHGINPSPVTIQAESAEDLRDVVRLLHQSLQLPVLDYETGERIPHGLARGR